MNANLRAFSGRSSCFARVLCIFAAVLLLAGGCGREESIRDDRPDAGASSSDPGVRDLGLGSGGLSPAAGAAEASDLEAIAASGSFSELYDLQQSLAASGRLSPETAQALNARWEALTEGFRRHSISDALDLAAFNWERIGEPGDDGWAEYRATYVFYVKQPIVLEPGVEAQMVLRMAYDPIHHKILWRRFPERQEIDRYSALNPALPDCVPGHYYLTVRTMQAPAVPANLLVFFSLVRISEDGAALPRSRYLGPYGDRARIGWRV